MMSKVISFSLFNTENREITLEIVAFQNNISNYSASLVSSPLKFKISNGIIQAFYISNHKFTRPIFCSKCYQDAWRTKNNSHITIFKCWRIIWLSPSTFFVILTSSLIFRILILSRLLICRSTLLIVKRETFSIFTPDRILWKYSPLIKISSCTACVAGSYSFANPYQASHCSQCPAQIDCFGGNQVGPKIGYWMGNPSDMNAIKCPYPGACLFEHSFRFDIIIFSRGGYVDYEYFPNGKCLYPHQGNLCNQCAPQFAKFGSKLLKALRAFN